MREPLAAQVQRLLADPVDRRLVASITGSADAVALAAALDEFVRRHLDGVLTEITSLAVSVGAGFGLHVDDGRHLFLKVWPSSTSRAALEAVHRVQARLHRQSFPAPAVVVAPHPFLDGHASVLGWLDRGEQQDAARPAVRRAMAAALARLIVEALPHAGLDALPRLEYPERSVWGPSHSVLFDFAATARGAGWIDEIGAASAAVARRGADRVVLGHRDWSVKNLRFDGGATGESTVSAVYDWDSLAVGPEAAIVGMAAATFTTTWDIPVVRLLPTPDDMAAFVADYEAAAGRELTGAERRIAGAAATYVLAYTARCEHCAGASGAPETWPSGSARLLLRDVLAVGWTHLLARR